PPVEATDSIAPAKWGWYPPRFIAGIVTLPVVATFPAALPEIVPTRALETTATLPRPPVKRPAIDCEKRTRKSAAPDTCRRAPKTMKRITYLTITAKGIP